LHTGFWCGNLREEDPGVGGRIYSNCTSSSRMGGGGGEWTGL